MIAQLMICLLVNREALALQRMQVEFARWLTEKGGNEFPANLIELLGPAL